MSFTQGISGLNAAASSLDVIGNNIANSQTVGFKGARAEFADMYAGATGIGTRVTGTDQNFSAGPIEQTSHDLDVAIVGSGFFRLNQGNQIVYSRNGQFVMDKDGFLVNSTGGKLTGYAGDVTGGAPDIIQVDRSSMPAKATSSAANSYNLNSNTSVGKGSTRSFTVEDSQGNKHIVELAFTKTASNTWDVKASIDGRTDNVQSGTVKFDTSGVLDPSTAKMQLNFGDLKNGTAPLSVAMDFTGSTQFARDFSDIAISENGYQAGDYSSVKFDKEGHIIASYSNNQKKTLGTLVMGTFANMNGLKPIGDTAYVETTESGQALIGTAGVGPLGDLTPNAREGSNVDMPSELVNMIISQRNYQANSQTIKTQDQILQTVMSMKS